MTPPRTADSSELQRPAQQQHCQVPAWTVSRQQGGSAGTAAALSIVDISAAPPKSGNAGRADLLHVQRHSATVQAAHAAWSRLVEHNAPGESTKLKATIQPLCGYACCRGQLLGVCAALITKHGCISGPL